MRHEYWIKFDNEPPKLHIYDNIDELWHKLREYLLYGRIIEWMIRY